MYINACEPTCSLNQEFQPIRWSDGCSCTSNISQWWHSSRNMKYLPHPNAAQIASSPSTIIIDIIIDCWYILHRTWLISAWAARHLNEPPLHHHHHHEAVKISPATIICLFSLAESVFIRTQLGDKLAHWKSAYPTFFPTRMQTARPQMLAINTFHPSSSYLCSTLQALPTVPTHHKAAVGVWAKPGTFDRIFNACHALHTKGFRGRGDKAWWLWAHVTNRGLQLAFCDNLLQICLV